MAPKVNRASNGTKPQQKPQSAANNGAQKAPNKAAAAPVLSPRQLREKAVGKPKAGKLLHSELVYKGKVFDVYKDTVREPNGKENTREVVRHRGSVVMLAVDESNDPDDPTVILIRQYRHAAGQFLIELPAGRIDGDEPPLSAAKRELIEETGLRAKRWTPLVRYFASPGFVGEWMQIYVARDIRHGDAAPEEDEHIEMLPTPLSQAMQLVADGKIHDGKTLIGLSLYSAALRNGGI